MLGGVFQLIKLLAGICILWRIYISTTVVYVLPLRYIELYLCIYASLGTVSAKYIHLSVSLHRIPDRVSVVCLSSRVDIYIKSKKQYILFVLRSNLLSTNALSIGRRIICTIKIAIVGNSTRMLRARH